ncbi:hypothetical protein [Carboxydothermus pertinax]|uniref:Uncharacterized protein n=1 Tax=Carboxydothermus pertinax TaxID=870242 RepID=A0A1L8CXH6_9THEO|nr:hypothetical protein [Carboxydothermus pertinax]GAV23628.1 hypothetical protein cpu_21380 [Carboxydothermus pertinax]
MRTKIWSTLKYIIVIFSILVFSNLVFSNTVALADSKPVIKLNHIFITKKDSNVNIQQIIQIDVPKGYKEQREGKVIKAFIPLPAGFNNVTINGLSKEEFVELKDGLGIVTIPESPLKLSINYLLPFNENSSINLSYPYACEMLAVLTIPGELAVKSNSLTPQGVLDITGKSFDVYATGNLNENTPISFELVKGQGNLQKAPEVYNEEPVNLKFHSPEHIQRWKNSPLGNTNPHLWLAFLIFVIGGIVVALIMLYRNKQDTLDEEEFLEKVTKLKEEEREILAKIEILDDKYDKGEVLEEEYNELLNHYKDQLKKVKIELKKLSE